MIESGITPDNLMPALTAQAARRGFPAGFRAAGLPPKLWRKKGLALALGLILPDLPEEPLRAEILGEEDRGDHVARHLRLRLCEGYEIPGLLLLPKGAGPHPAALTLHDHGSEFRIGKEKCVTPLGGRRALVEAWAARFFSGALPGDALARRGWAALCLDAPGWGERPGNGYEAQQALACNLMQLGYDPAGLLAWEDLRAAAYLAGLPEIDPARIAAVGFSWGGFRAWRATALSPHLAAGGASGWMASLPELLVAGNNHLRGQSAFWMTHPALHRHLDLPDLAALAAPKPLLIQTGATDRLFPDPAVNLAYYKLAEVWRAWGAEDRLKLTRPAGGHVFDAARQAEAFDWLEAALPRGPA